MLPFMSLKSVVNLESSFSCSNVTSSLFLFLSNKAKNNCRFFCNERKRAVLRDMMKTYFVLRDIKCLKCNNITNKDDRKFSFILEKYESVFSVMPKLRKFSNLWLHLPERANLTKLLLSILARKGLFYVISVTKEKGRRCNEMQWPRKKLTLGQDGIFRRKKETKDELKRDFCRDFA